MRVIVVTGLVCCGLVGCQARRTVPAEGPRALSGLPALISLAGSVDPLRDHFNELADKHRVISILSPTCGPCVSGAVAVNEVVVKSFPEADIGVGVVWIDMLGSDDEASARRAATIFDDARVRQFHDPHQRAGRAFGAALAGGSAAWDIYMFFPAGTRWESSVPAPAEWLHQLGGDVADPARLRSGAALASGLHEAMSALGHEAARAAPDEESLALARRSATDRIASARAAETGEGRVGQCAKCIQGRVPGQCRLGGWRYVEASIAGPPAEGQGIAVWLRGQAQAPASFAGEGPAPDRLVLAVEGMECDDCTAHVALTVLAHRGVRRVEVTYDPARAVVHLDPELGDGQADAILTSLRLKGYDAREARMPGHPVRIQFLYFDGCPHSPRMRENLRAAIASLGWDVAVTPVDLQALGRGDELLRYGAPTVLVNGSDLMGAAPGPNAELSCRVYPGGGPDAQALAARLAQRAGRE